MRFKSLSIISVLAVCVLAVSPGAFGQNLSVGVVAGTSLTDDFRTQFFSSPGYPQVNYLQTSGSTSFIGGPMIDWRLPAGFSVEADGLYRGLHGNGPSPFSVVTWEFPVLAKYRFAVPLAKPFIEAGPSFRTAANLNWANPSHHGFTAGVGLEMRLRGVNIAPEVRYTRWAADNNPNSALTKPDQVEVLVGFSGNSGVDSRPFGRLVSFGVVLGTNLTNDFQNVSYPVIVETGLPNGGIQSMKATSLNYSGPKSFLVGPTFELHLPKQLSVEVDALYRPLSSAMKTVLSNGETFGPFTSNSTFVTWQFPVLAKYKFPFPFEQRFPKPFLDLGPSFRTAQRLNFSALSIYGVTVGAGLEAHFHALRIAPAVRYTYWGPDSPRGQTQTLRNEADLLVGFSF